MQTVFPKNILQDIIESLNTHYSRQESESLAYIILEHVFGLSKTTILINQKIESDGGNRIEDIVSRLSRSEPIQHILGFTEFYGRKFFVNENVLIPRQETEELIHLIESENTQKNLKVLDIGTGSGCIACSLSLELNEPFVHAIDISSKALKVAVKNAENLNCNISFMLLDILQDELIISELDIIVSNPPYVTETDKEQMHQNVLAFEPELALFVSDDDPLIFYKVISQKGKSALKNGGRLYFEINELFGKDVALLMEQNGFENVRIHKDLNGKNRFVSGNL